jgi:UDP-N-acetyl-D-mannosaminuronate dehydrogenase
MPRFTFEFIKNRYPELKGVKILLLGVSYRGDVGDTRYSPVEMLFNYLVETGSTVSCHDPYVKYWDEQSLNIDQDLSTHLNQSLDIIILSTGHSIYKQDKTVDKIYNLEPLLIFDTIGHLSNKQINRLKKKHTVKVLGRGDI